MIKGTNLFIIEKVPICLLLRKSTNLFILKKVPICLLYKYQFVYHKKYQFVYYKTYQFVAPVVLI
jgi:hypothetical protein